MNIDIFQQFLFEQNNLLLLNNLILIDNKSLILSKVNK